MVGERSLEETVESNGVRSGIDFSRRVEEVLESASTYDQRRTVRTHEVTYRWKYGVGGRSR